MRGQACSRSHARPFYCSHVLSAESSSPSGLCASSGLFPRMPRRGAVPRVSERERLARAGRGQCPMSAYQERKADGWRRLSRCRVRRSLATSAAPASAAPASRRPRPTVAGRWHVRTPRNACDGDSNRSRRCYRRRGYRRRRRGAQPAISRRRERNGRRLRPSSRQHAGHADVVGVHAAVEDGDITVARHTDARFTADRRDGGFPHFPTRGLANMRGACGPQTIGEGEQEEGAFRFLASSADRAEPQQSVASNNRDIGAVRQVMFEVILPRPSRKHHAVPP